nr:hypothetical protein [Tanacetum cinerariifolium]
DLDHANKVLSMQEEETEPIKVQEVVDVVTTIKLITKVVTAANTTITAAAPTLTAAPTRRTNGVVIRDPKESTTATSSIVHSEAKSKDKVEITKLKRRVKNMERRNKVKVLKLRRLQKVGTIQRIDSSEDNVIDDLITKVVTAANTTITAAAPTLTAAPTRRTNGVVIRDPKESTTATSSIVHSEAKSKDKGKGILTKEQIEEEESIALKRINETPVEKAAK